MPLQRGACANAAAAAAACAGGESAWRVFVLAGPELHLLFSLAACNPEARENARVLDDDREPGDRAAARW